MIYFTKRLKFCQEVAGAYLFAHYNLLNNLCYSRKNRNLIHSTKELSLLDKKGDLLAQKLLTHSASLIACQIAGIYQYKKEILGFKKINFDYVSDLEFRISDLLFTITGSLFLHGWHYKQMVKDYTKKILNLF